MDEVLQQAPSVYVVLDKNDVIVEANLLAEEVGFSGGQIMQSFFPDLNEAFVEFVKFQPDAHIYRFSNQGRDKQLKAQTIEAGEHLHVWLMDMSEQLMLARQIKSLKQPSQRRTRQIQQLVSTSLGYGELLSVVMDDETLSREKLGTVHKYLSEITEALKRINALNQGLRAGDLSGANIIVAEASATLAELIAELLRSEGYQVVAFSEAQPVLEYLAITDKPVSRAIIDETLVDQDDQALIEVLKSKYSDLAVVQLTNSESTVGDECSISKPLDFNQLLEVVVGDS